MATYYVSSAGSDSNAGTSTAAPWLTIAKVNASSSSADTIYFRGGDTFNDATLAVKANQVIASYGTGAATLHTNNAQNAMSIGGSGIQLSGLIFQGPTSSTSFNLIQASVAGSLDGLTITDCQFIGGQYQFNGGGSATGNVTVTRCSFSTSTHDAFTTRNSVTATLSWCSFVDVGINTGGGAGDPITTHDTATVTVTDCYFRNCQRGAGLSIHTAGTNTWRRCLVVTGADTSVADLHGGFANGGDGATVCENCIVILNGAQFTAAFSVTIGTLAVNHCVVINNNSHAGTVAFYASGAAVVTVKNSISVIGSGAGIHAWDNTVGITGYSANGRNNQFYPDGAAKWAATSTPIYGDFATWVALGKDVTGSSVPASSPLYKATGAAGAQDARLATGATAVNGGTDVGLTTDFLNRTRLIAASVDIGAIEFRRGFQGME